MRHVISPTHPFRLLPFGRVPFFAVAGDGAAMTSGDWNPSALRVPFVIVNREPRVGVLVALVPVD